MEVTCDPCNMPMQLLFQAKDDHGKDVFTFYCDKCRGQAAVQDEAARAPELKPIQPQAQHQMQIEVGHRPAPTLAQVRGSIQPAHRVE